MSKRQVRSILGPPDASMTTRQFQREFDRAGGRMLGFGSNQLLWSYFDVSPGQDIQVVFRWGRVVAINHPRTG